MSTLKVNNIDTVSGTNISIASGKTFSATGHVIQVQSFVLTSATTIASNSFTDTGLACSITPSSTSNKILITGFLNCGADYFKSHIILLRGSTTLSIADASGSRPQVYSASHPGGSDWDSYATTPVALNLLDSPNTTSSVTYKVQCKAYQGATGTASINLSLIHI